MKNQREIYADMDYVKKLEDRLSFLEELADVSPNPEPAKWYENIPEGGVLCWPVHEDGTIGCSPVLVLHGDVNPDDYVILTKQEIQVFMDNAPEDV